MLKAAPESAGNGTITELTHHILNLLFNLYHTGEVKIEEKIHEE